MKMSFLGKKSGVLVSSSFLGYDVTGGISGFLPCLCPGIFQPLPSMFPPGAWFSSPFLLPAFLMEGLPSEKTDFVDIARIHAYFCFSSFACQNPEGVLGLMEAFPQGDLMSPGRKVQRESLAQGQHEYGQIHPLFLGLSKELWQHISDG